MGYDPARHHRRSIRLEGYDYTRPGAYFVTIFTQDRLKLFGEVGGGGVQLSEAGEIARNTWLWLAERYSYVVLDEWVVMPDHLHGILVIADDAQRHKPLGGLIGAYKTVSTKQINQIRNTPGAKLWHRNYWEHIIRHEAALNRIRKYILNNPARWSQKHPAGQQPG